MYVWHAFRCDRVERGTHVGALIALKESIEWLLSEKAATRKKLAWGRNCQKLFTTFDFFSSCLASWKDSIRTRDGTTLPKILLERESLKRELWSFTLFRRRPERLVEVQGTSESVKSLSEVSGNKEAKLDGVERISRSRCSSPHWIFRSPLSRLCLFL